MTVHIVLVSRPDPNICWCKRTQSGFIDLGRRKLTFMVKRMLIFTLKKVALPQKNLKEIYFANNVVSGLFVNQVEIPLLRGIFIKIF